MRLTHFEVEAIKKHFTENFGSQDHLWLFGSRTDPAKKGGDIDLYIETPSPERMIYKEKEIRFLVMLKDEIEDQKIDVVINFLPEKKDKLIYQEARRTGIQLV